MRLRPTPAAAIVLFLGTACTDDPPVSTPTTDTDTGEAPTSFDPPPIPPTTAAEPTTGGTTGTTSTGEPELTSTTAPDTPFCGDGVVAGDEECDLGGANANTGTCTLECKHAVCGDGLVWAGVEACDFGLGNDYDYGGCRPDDCQWGPRCGDGVLDPGHEACDRGDLNGTGVTTDEYSPCSVTCGHVGRVLFITSQTYHGALGGVSGADLKCFAAAQAAGLPNPSKYRAWISDEAMSPVTRLSQWNALYPPIILVGGLVVADDFAELVELGPRTGIARSELGAPLFDRLVWTNTSAYGEVFSATHHCGGWLSNSDQLKARAGYNALAVEDGPDWQLWRDQRYWTSYSSPNCDQQAHLYCIDDSILLEPEN